MAFVVNNILIQAMQYAGAIAAGEDLNPDDQVLAFNTLNMMIDSESNNPNLVYHEDNEVFPFVNGQQTYTIGTGGDFNTNRPIRIDKAYWRYPTIQSQQTDISIRILEYSEYADIVAKSIPANIPLCLYYNPTFPLGQITVWPVTVPGTGYSLVLWSTKTITTFSSINQVVSLPPGYSEYLTTSLAIRLCVLFGREVPPALEGLAVNARGRLGNTNVVVPILQNPFRPFVNGTYPIPSGLLTGM